MKADSIHSSHPIEDMNSFSVLKSTVSGGIERRLGRFALPGRRALPTPHYIAISSRGTVPHVSPDMLRWHTDVRGVYVALEDCKLLSYLQLSMAFQTDMSPLSARTGACKL